MPAYPQNVTERYVRRLLIKGRNDQFELDRIELVPTIVEGKALGQHYRITLVEPMRDMASVRGVGLTPAGACRTALEAAGVTFND